MCAAPVGGGRQRRVLRCVLFFGRNECGCVRQRLTVHDVSCVLYRLWAALRTGDGLGRPAGYEAYIYIDNSSYPVISKSYHDINKRKNY